MDSAPSLSISFNVQMCDTTVVKDGNTSKLINTNVTAKAMAHVVVCQEY